MLKKVHDLEETNIEINVRFKIIVKTIIIKKKNNNKNEVDGKIFLRVC